MPCGTLALAMDPPPPGFVRVHLTCRACGEAETLDLQTHAMTPERLHRIWRPCGACLSSDLEIAAESLPKLPLERREAVSQAC